MQRACRSGACPERLFVEQHLPTSLHAPPVVLSTSGLCAAFLLRFFQVSSGGGIHACSVHCNVLGLLLAHSISLVVVAVWAFDGWEADQHRLIVRTAWQPPLTAVPTAMHPCICCVVVATVLN